MIKLTDSEVRELKKLYVSYKIEEDFIVQSDWKTLRFESTKRHVRLVPHEDRTATIKQVYDPLTMLFEGQR